MNRYKFLATAGGLALAASIVSAGAASANVGSTLVVNGTTGSMCLDATNDATHSAASSGDPIQLWSCNGDSQQKWNFNENVGSYGTITNGYAGLCLDARDDATYNPGTDGDPVQLWSCNGGSQQQWEPVYEEDSSGTYYYALVNKADGLVLDARDDATWNPTKDGDPVQLWGWLGGANQLWAY